MNYIQVTIQPVTEEQKEILVALLSNEGYEGFVEEETSMKAFISRDLFSEEALADVLAVYQLSYISETIEKQNWNKVWESNFDPVVVNDFVAIRADFHEPIKDVQHEILITPKMSFGTGHHATTFMMIEEMGKLDIDQKTVFDFGTGTGILAILADKLGAASVYAIDNDEWSIENATENVEKNNCGNVTLQLADTAVTGKQYDVILANINKNIILSNLDALITQLSTSGHLLLSGLLVEDESEISDALKKYDITHLTTNSKKQWICMVFKAKS
ncbi:50S ribosomal protein L11 methyltransferase [Danxiaibacter flavus]|uniref:Ribosomal protein L11 methyltransferase n=1 Tax=Danxiaibacter flavus TaxID=3049108 RepID=A0ABV3ZLK2_9BACT|nr:50S ribosomal protein L11 methyltransferase [Chitinophagaceae bacterium DXS]